MSYFVVSFSYFNKTMNNLTERQIEILTDYYSRQYEAQEAWGALYNTLERYGDQEKYYIYKAICPYVKTIKQFQTILVYFVRSPCGFEPQTLAEAECHII